MRHEWKISRSMNFCTHGVKNSWVILSCSKLLWFMTCNQCPEVLNKLKESRGRIVNIIWWLQLPHFSSPSLNPDSSFLTPPGAKPKPSGFGNRSNIFLRLVPCQVFVTNISTLHAHNHNIYWEVELKWTRRKIFATQIRAQVN